MKEKILNDGYQKKEVGVLQAKDVLHAPPLFQVPVQGVLGNQKYSYTNRARSRAAKMVVA
jgi:hypothetical protein